MDDDPDARDVDAPLGTEDRPLWLRSGTGAAPEAAVPEEPAAEEPDPLIAEPAAEEPDLVESTPADGPADDPAPVPPWADRAVIVGWGLLAVIAVVLLGTLLEGVAASSRQGSLLARLGAAWVGQAGPSEGLALLLAAGLAAWSRAQRLLAACLIAAAAVCVATPLAMLGDVANLRHTHQPVNALVRWELLTNFGVIFIPAALAALVASWGRTDGLGSPGH